MNVTISVGGKFHAFYLARQLYIRESLDKIYTGYPWFAVRNSKVPREHVVCLPFAEMLSRASLAYAAAEFFDKQVARRLYPCDIFIGAPAYSLHTIKRMRARAGGKVIIEQVSNHILGYCEALKKEEERLKISLPSSEIIQKVLKEYQEADFIVVPSSFAKQSFLDKGFRDEKVISVLWGVDQQIFRPVPKEDSRFRIICVGMRFIKGIHYLLQALDELKVKDIEFWLIGGKPDELLKTYLKKYSGLYKYLGPVPQGRLYKYYSQSSVLILPSIEDAFGMVVSEAMACGIPVICSDCVGAKDIVRENADGFVIPAKDIEKLKEKIIYLYENMDVCRQMGISARENVLNNFTWDKYGQRIINIYQDLLKK